MTIGAALSATSDSVSWCKLDQMVARMGPSRVLTSRLVARKSSRANWRGSASPPLRMRKLREHVGSSRRTISQWLGVACIESAPDEVINLHSREGSRASSREAAPARTRQSGRNSSRMEISNPIVVVADGVCPSSKCICLLMLSRNTERAPAQE